jgi:flagellar protein FliS
MASNAQDMYLESRVLSADGVELVQILCQGALEAVEGARRHLAAGEIVERSRAISRACAILTELAVSLDHNSGGELSRSLLELYDYMQRRLLEANVSQTEPPLAEVSKLLGVLLEGWLSCRTLARASAEPAYPASSLEPEHAQQGQYVEVSY